MLPSTKDISNGKCKSVLHSKWPDIVRLYTKMYKLNSTAFGAGYKKLKIPMFSWWRGSTSVAISFLNFCSTSASHKSSICIPLLHFPHISLLTEHYILASAHYCFLLLNQCPFSLRNLESSWVVPYFHLSSNFQLFGILSLSSAAFVNQVRSTT